MKSSYEVRAKKFLEQVLPFIAGCMTLNDYEGAIACYNEQYNRHVHVAHGQTRIALITSDYVIKLNYGDKAKYWGNNQSEYRTYQKAVADGFGYLFAPITKVKVSRRVFYIMPKVTGIGRSHHDVDCYLTPEENYWVKEHCWDLHCYNYGWSKGKPVIIDYAAH